MSKDDGFVLMICLLTLTVIAFLAASSLHLVIVYEHAMFRLKQRHEQLYRLEAVALGIVRGAILQPGYRYTIQDLGDVDCLDVLVQGKKYTSQHRIISVYQLGPDGNTEAMLQLREIKPHGLSECKGESRIITPGIVSWRYL